jgi:hypothetical protein
MSAAALAQRLRAGAVPGVNQAERNGWNGQKTPVPFQKNRPVPETKLHENHWVTDVTATRGTDGTGGTGVFVGVEVEHTKSRPDQAANDAPMPAPATTPAPASSTAAPALTDWRQADADYLRHHFTCPSCCAAGHGRGQRCATGADLWATYEAACDAAQPSKTQGGNAR